MANVTGLIESDAEILLLAILGYIVLIFLLAFIHRKLLKKHKKSSEKLTFLYDTIRYQIAKVQYGNPAIQDIAGIHTILQSDHKNYTANHQRIKQEIEAIEQKFGQSIISADQRKTINKQDKKRKTLTTFVQLIGRFITTITVGIYKLFR